MQSNFIQIYVRALCLLAPECVSVTMLAIANAAVATLKAGRPRISLPEMNRSTFETTLI
jgi:hypothetical protein